MGARKRQPVHQLLSNLRAPGTLAVLIAMLGAVITTSPTGAEVDGNAYTGENFGWSIEWDEDDWDFDEEDNSGGSDFLALTSVDGRNDTVTYFASEDLSDPKGCVSQWAEVILPAIGAEDFEQIEDTDAIDVRPGGEAVVYRVEIVGQTSTVSAASYVQCFPLTDDVTIRVAALVDLKPREKTFAAIEDMLQTLETSDSDDNDRNSSADRDDERAPTVADDSTESDEDSGRGTFDSGRVDDAGREDDADQDETANQDADTQQDNDDCAEVEDDNERDDADDDRRDEETADTGIDGNEYSSPTYGFSVEWDDDVWSVAPDDELINHQPGDLALDRLVLDTEGGTLYIEGRADFDDGDLEGCVDREFEALEQSDDISNFEVRDDENGDPMEGETADGAYKAITLTMDDVNLAEYVECRSIDDGESVLVITLITRASDFDDATVVMADVVDSIDV